MNKHSSNQLSPRILRNVLHTASATNAGAVKQNYRRASTQQISTTNNYKVSAVDNANVKLDNGLLKQAPRPNLLQSNYSRPSKTAVHQTSNRPVQPYRGSLTQAPTYTSQTDNDNNSNDVQAVSHQQSSAAVRSTKVLKRQNLGSTYNTNQLAEATAYANKNNLLTDVINKPVVPVRAVLPQRRAVLPQSSTHSSNEQIPPTNVETNDTIPRSSSSLSQGRKSALPMPVANQLKQPNVTSVSRYASSNIIPSSQSSDSVGKSEPSIQHQQGKIPDNMSPSQSWNEGCY
ncbi:unnamed protein product [Didymodactylos carnosus]|uniref:Uncharacterized protein n=1 Tax=Didymodactylos carnosus TaxID=1234261 RepID=A0A813S9D9_9BILA|nr:unnamed protein product [Didymodactylos carnosus]CAF3576285.1 unnamed protein product [Didymodactylos carnosus]